MKTNISLLLFFWINVSCVFAQDTLFLYPQFNEESILTQFSFGQEPEIQVKLVENNLIDSWTMIEEDELIGRIVLLKTMDEGYFWKVWYHDTLIRIKPCCEPFDKLLALEEIEEYKIITEDKKVYLVDLRDKTCLGLFNLSENAKSGIPFQLKTEEGCDYDKWLFISPKSDFAYEIPDVIKWIFAYIALNNSTFRLKTKIANTDK